MTVIAVAGKNAIAVAGARLALSAQKARGLIGSVKILCNANDVGQDGWQPSLRKFAESEPGLEVVHLTDVYAIEDLLFLSLEFDQIVDVARFTSTRLYNIHFSLLPAYKGMYTSALPILHGAAKTGVTLHQIDHGIDTGPIAAQLEIPIDDDDTGRSLYHKYLDSAETLLRAQFDNLLDDRLELTPQSASGSTYYAKSAIDYRALKISWRKTAWEVRNQLRAFSFREYQMPTISDDVISGSRILAQRSTSKPGTVQRDGSGRAIVATIDYDIELELSPRTDA